MSLTSYRAALPRDVKVAFVYAIKPGLSRVFFNN